MGLFFSPSGRIGPAAYLKGMIIIGVLFGFANFLPRFNPIMGSFAFGIGMLIAIWPVVAMGIKRAHDSGKSGWFGLVFLLILIVVYFILSAVAGMFVGQDELLAMKEALDSVKGTTDMAELTAVMNEYGRPYYEKAALPSAIASFLSFPAAAFISNMLAKSEPNENRFGPQTFGDS